eukprot:m51a1_g1459 hypothetical protein (1126) ;mRNA; f:203263-208748
MISQQAHDKALVTANAAAALTGPVTCAKRSEVFTTGKFVVEGSCARCTRCGMTVPMKDGNTSGLLWHEQSKHMPMFNQTTHNQFIPIKAESPTHMEIEKCIVGLVTEELRPLSIAESPNLRKLMDTLRPGASKLLPSRRDLSRRLIPETYEKLCVEVAAWLNEGNKKVAVSADTWTSAHEDNYVTHYAHFITCTFKYYVVLLDVELVEGTTAQDTCNVLTRLKNKFEIEIIAYVGDTMSINPAAAAIGGFDFWGCSLHVLALSVNNAIESDAKLVTLLDTVKKVVVHFAHSAKDARLLSAYLDKHQTPAIGLKRRLVQANKTRWNSTFNMLQRFLLFYDGVVSVLSQSSTYKQVNLVSIIGPQKVDYLQQVVDVLSFPAAVTNEMQRLDALSKLPAATVDALVAEWERSAVTGSVASTLSAAVRSHYPADRPAAVDDALALFVAAHPEYAAVAVAAVAETLAAHPRSYSPMRPPYCSFSALATSSEQSWGEVVEALGAVCLAQASRGLPSAPSCVAWLADSLVDGPDSSRVRYVSWLRGQSVAAPALSSHVGALLQRARARGAEEERSLASAFAPRAVEWHREADGPQALAAMSAALSAHFARRASPEAQRQARALVRSRPVVFQHLLEVLVQENPPPATWFVANFLHPLLQALADDDDDDECDAAAASAAAGAMDTSDDAQRSPSPVPPVRALAEARQQAAEALLERFLRDQTLCHLVFAAHSPSAAGAGAAGPLSLQGVEHFVAKVLPTCGETARPRVLDVWRRAWLAFEAPARWQWDRATPLLHLLPDLPPDVASLAKSLFSAMLASAASLPAPESSALLSSVLSFFLARTTCDEAVVALLCELVAAMAGTPSGRSSLESTTRASLAAVPLSPQSRRALLAMLESAVSLSAPEHARILAAAVTHQSCAEALLSSSLASDPALQQSALKLLSAASAHMPLRCSRYTVERIAATFGTSSIEVTDISRKLLLSIAQASEDNWKTCVAVLAHKLHMSRDPAACNETIGVLQDVAEQRRADVPYLLDCVRAKLLSGASPSVGAAVAAQAPAATPLAQLPEQLPYACGSAPVLRCQLNASILKLLAALAQAGAADRESLVAVVAPCVSLSALYPEEQRHYLQQIADTK